MLALKFALVSNPVGLTILALGAGLIIWDWVDAKLLNPLDTVDKAKESLDKSLYEPNQRTREQLDELDRMMGNGGKCEED